MRYLARLAALAALLSPATLFATPVVYSFNSADSFTLAGTSYAYSGYGRGIVPPNQLDQMEIWVVTDTSTFVPYYYDNPITHQMILLYTSTSDLTAYVGYQGNVLASINGPLDLAFELGNTIQLGTGTTPGSEIFSDQSGLFFTVGPSFLTSRGELYITDNTDQGGQCSSNYPGCAFPGVSAATPEPSSLGLLATGALGALALLRRRPLSRSHESSAL